MIYRLINACERGDLEEVTRLVGEGGEEIVNKQDAWGYTPLIMASQCGHLPIVDLLLEAGADMNKADRFERTPFWVASRNGHLSVVNRLIDAGGADFDAGNNIFGVPITTAFHEGHVDVVETLLAHGADGSLVDTPPNPNIDPAKLKLFHDFGIPMLNEEEDDDDLR